MTTALIERITSAPIVYDFNAEEISTLCAGFRELKIAGIDDKAGYKRVHEARMQLKRMRVAGPRQGSRIPSGNRTTSTTTSDTGWT